MACILVYDLSQLDPTSSEEQLDTWMQEFINNCGPSASNPSSNPYASPYENSNPLSSHLSGGDSIESLQSISFIVLGNKFDKVRELAGERGDDWQRLTRIMENRINAWCQVQLE